MKDFQVFQLRKRIPFSRNRLPELLRMQMGQANLLVAKGDFKQAADICMEIVTEGNANSIWDCVLGLCFS